ncbi:uncharacterized protein LOC131595330 isoform X3 [Vicia villosa]|uniref:uncharacterized protein LOC131595330 isoform X3 n=1 Tax=Vicia villosa TaxID=3911 RepID=UPI00273B4D7E|nr:uncharacterized protein LOC131595330 isoform X3 [Vicia villosa]
MGHSAAVWEFRVAAELTKGWNGVDQVVLHTPQSTSARLVGCFIMMVHLIKMLSTTAEALIMLDSCGSNIIELGYETCESFNNDYGIFHQITSSLSSSHGTITRIADTGGPNGT